MVDRSTGPIVEPQMGLGRSILLHLAPGALITVFYLALAPLVMRVGYPALLALLLSILFILVPFELGYLWYQSWRHYGRVTFEGVILYRQPIPTWQYLVFVPLLLVWIALCSSLLAPLDRFLASHLFAWMPAWTQPLDPAALMASSSRSALVTTFLVGLALSGIAAPLVEELYFRGYLLPRLSRFGLWGATVINILLFSLYHFFSPWQNVTRILALLPLVYLVARKKNIYLGIATHCILNTVNMLMTLFRVLS